MSVNNSGIPDGGYRLPTEQKVEVVEAETRNNMTPREIQEILDTKFKDYPLLVEIARCESHFRQFDENGEIFRGVVNPDDVGVMQINTHFHEETAKKLNIDLYTLEGNTDYAIYLYNKEGSRPWNYSGACWRNSPKAVELAKN